MPKFLAISRGFITNDVIDTEDNIITMSLVIEIPLAYQENNLPVYTVHQIGFIPKTGGPCLKLTLPKRLAYKEGVLYEVHCQSDSCTDTMASITPSCIVNGSKTYCDTKLSNCLMHQSSFNMNYGLLVTTSHIVHSISKNGTFFSNGSLHVHWHGLSRIEVRVKGSSINETFYPPNCNLSGKSDVFPIDMHFDEIQYE